MSSETSTRPPPAREEIGTPALRRIDRILHVRAADDGGVLVTEAAFPFTTVRFSRDGVETWRAAPDPDELRRLLQETDLQYVIATPAFAVDDAVLNSFVALRSGRRVSALRRPDDTSVRYRDVPGDLALLAALPRQRLLVATRRGAPDQLILFRWRWTDQRQGCTHPEG